MSAHRDQPESSPQVLQHFRSSLQSFTKSAATFQLLSTIPASQNPSTCPPKTLYILDSAFNPPTVAHLHLAYSALKDVQEARDGKRLLLLIVTQNTVKPFKPVAWEHRLAMMTLFARNLQSNLKASADSSGHSEVIPIDIGVIKKPFFVDKPMCISESSTYPPSTEQVYLIGFDILLGMLNPKYYPPHHTLDPLDPFLSQHRLRATYRADDKWGTKEDQDAYVEAFGRGEQEHVGGKREWAKKICLSEGPENGDILVSSSKTRLAAKEGSSELEKLVLPEVREWIVSNGLYKE